MVCHVYLAVLISVDEMALKAAQSCKAAAYRVWCFYRYLQNSGLVDPQEVAAVEAAIAGYNHVRRLLSLTCNCAQELCSEVVISASWCYPQGRSEQ